MTDTYLDTINLALSQAKQLASEGQRVKTDIAFLEKIRDAAKKRCHKIALSVLLELPGNASDAQILSAIKRARKAY